MIVLALLLSGQAAATPVPALGDDTQLSCTVVGPGDRAPTALSIDFRSRRQPNAVLAFAGESQFARVSSTSTVQRRADGVLVIGFATGNGQYRLELTPQREAARVRIASAVDRTTRLTVAQGYCGSRRGRPLKVRPPVPLTVDDAVAPRPWRLTPLPGRLPDGTCRVIGRDGRVQQLSYQITASQGNELSATYRFAGPGLTGAATAAGMGTQFFLVAPAERLVATTVGIGGTPATYVHITFERLGNFVDLSRAGEIFAVGECGQPPIWVAAPATMPTSARP